MLRTEYSVFHPRRKLLTRVQLPNSTKAKTGGKTTRTLPDADYRSIFTFLPINRSPSVSTLNPRQTAGSGLLESAKEQNFPFHAYAKHASGSNSPRRLDRSPAQPLEPVTFSVFHAVIAYVMAPHTRKNLASAFTGHTTLRLGLPRPFWKLSNFVLHINRPIIVARYRLRKMLGPMSLAVQCSIALQGFFPYFDRPPF